MQYCRAMTNNTLCCILVQVSESRAMYCVPQFLAMYSVAFWCKSVRQCTISSNVFCCILCKSVYSVTIINTIEFEPNNYFFAFSFAFLFTFFTSTVPLILIAFEATACLFCLGCSSRSANSLLVSCCLQNDENYQAMRE
jgi:hypothetical protein